jgi:PAS domain S-box-containing protein
VLPYRRTDNVIDGVVLTAIDVTTLKQLETAHARLLQLLESSTVGFFCQDRRLRYTWVFSRVFGLQPKQLLGKLDREVFDSVDADTLLKLKQEVLSTGLPLRRRVTLTQQGARRVYELYLEALRDEAENIIGLSCLAMDVTNTI